MDDSQLENIYFEIDKRLDKIDFDCLYKGFYRFQFALYNDEQALNGNFIAEVDENQHLFRLWRRD